MDPRLPLSFAVSLLEGGASARSWSLKRYPIFGLLMAASCLTFLNWFTGAPSTKSYREVWFWSQWFLLVLQLGAVVESAALVLSNYDGIQKALRKLVAIALVLSGGFAFLSTMEIWTYRGRWALIYGAIRYSGAMFSVVCALAWWLGKEFGDGVAPNCIRHSRILSLYFLAHSAAYVAMAAVPAHPVIIGTLVSATQAGLSGWWMLGMDKAGEVASALLPDPEGDGDLNAAVKQHRELLSIAQRALRAKVSGR